MRVPLSLSRATVRTTTLALLLAGTVLGGPARAAGASDGGGAVPACVQVSAGWRYTFVANGCDTPWHGTVEYADGQDVPCRTAAPGETVTFPGHGTGDNRVIGLRACPDAEL
ncbi:hypothetical protein GCM10010420_40540 [Streptomyces glaucosporus]|uniref:Alpha-amylase inhibitor n=1 Tax=Streptomyces glaucosporus TaxID=284044 RepID=A0ABP5VSZ4_9ACTN